MKLLARERPVANAMIADPEQHTVMDAAGAVRSIQAADVEIPEALLEAIWTPMYLERLARTYWRYLSRVTLGLIRVRYTEDQRDVVLLARPLMLLRFRAPEYELDRAPGDRALADHATGCWSRRRDEGFLRDRRPPPARRPAGLRAACTSRSRWRTSTRRSRTVLRAGSTARPSRAST